MVWHIIWRWKHLKAKKTNIKNPHPAPYNIIILYDARLVLGVCLCKTLWNLSPFSTAVYIHVHRRAISLYVYMWRYTIYVYTYYTALAGEIWILCERDPRVQCKRLRYITTISFDPLGRVQLFNYLVYSNGRAEGELPERDSFSSLYSTPPPPSSYTYYCYYYYYIIRYPIM